MSKTTLNKRRRRPTHPGEVLREEILPAANITQMELAKRMGVSRRTVNEICQERRGVSADVAHRLARMLNTTPDVWMNMQAAVDVWDALDANGKVYQKIKPL
jgi:antitoxin HigA-1